MRRLIVSLAVMGVLCTPHGGSGQLVRGAFGSYAVDAFDGAVGAGVLLGVDVPILPVAAYGSATWFFVDCTGCSLKGWSVGVSFRPLPFPLARPYFVVGVTERSLDNPGGGSVLDSSGAFTGVGLDLALTGLGLFAEARYEFLDGELAQPVLRAGVLF